MHEHRQPGPPGGTVWLTGLPSAGKNTLARGLADAIAREGRRVEVLDGDKVRRFLSAGLGFSREERGITTRRIGWVAQILAWNGVVVLVPVLAPFADDREAVAQCHASRDLFFLEVHVEAPMEVCAARDVRGLYARYAKGMLKGLIGVDEPYEPPRAPGLRVDTHGQSVEQSVRAVRVALQERGLL